MVVIILILTILMLFLFLKCSIDKRENENKIKIGTNAVYHLIGSRGRELFLYENKCVIKVKPGFISFLTGNATDGEKTIFYQDIIGIQHKEPGLTLGYIQLETAATIMNNRRNNFFNENTFTYENDIPQYAINNAVKYINKKIEENKSIVKNDNVIKSQVIENTSKTSLEEIKKLKELLDIGAITQEEFDKKKKELLNL